MLRVNVLELFEECALFVSSLVSTAMNGGRDDVWRKETQNARVQFF